MRLNPYEVEVIPGETATHRLINQSISVLLTTGFTCRQEYIEHKAEKIMTVMNRLNTGRRNHRYQIAFTVWRCPQDDSVENLVEFAQQFHKSCSEQFIKKENTPYEFSFAYEISEDTCELIGAFMF